MPSKLYSCALRGIEAYGVEIEVDILNGLPRFMVVGLGDAAIQESKERVRSALIHSGMQFPNRRKVVNLAPADIKKCGPAFDLPIAVGLLSASGQVSLPNTEKALFLGELALDGNLRSIHGVLSCAFFAKEHGFTSFYIPEVNGKEALMVPELDIFPVQNLQQLIAHLNGKSLIRPIRRDSTSTGSAAFSETLSQRGSEDPLLDLRFVQGCDQALRALAIASAGGHHVLMTGPPGSGKTLLAQCLPSLLPPLTFEESIELTKIYSAAGLLRPHRPIIQKRPFRSVHHTASAVSLVGGGSVVRPGEISLAHRGVLFLDEIAEFPRSILETLRQPLEDKCVTIARASNTVTFPAHFIFIAAMNPCPCGYDGDEKQKCRCSPKERQRYRQRLSGPLLDRMDLFVTMRRVSFDSLYVSSPENGLDSFYAALLRARQVQTQRFGSSVVVNSDIPPSQIRNWCAVDEACQKVLREAMDRYSLSARGCHRVLKVARTIADMEGSENIQEAHVLEALRYRMNL